MVDSAALPKGVIASSMTPFHPDGSVNHDAIEPHIDWLLEEGVVGLSPTGTAGEFYQLESADRRRVLDTVVEANNGRVPIMAGTHHFNTRITIELSRHAEQAGATSVLMVPSYYASPTTPSVMNHLRRVAEAISIPIVLYHSASMTGSDLSTAQIKALFDEGVIGAVKFSTVYPDRLVDLLQATQGKLPIYAGYDFVAFEGLCHGVHGWISGIPSIVPRAAVDLYKAITERGDLTSAREQWALLAPLMRYLFQLGGNPYDGAHSTTLMRAALNQIGPNLGDPVSPIAPATEAQMARMGELLRALGYKTH